MTRRRRRAIAALAIAASAACLAALLPGLGSSASGQTPAPVGHKGQYLLDAQGRAVILHGLNQVYKLAPYTPSSGGFGDDDAAFLQANGFNAMRVGVIWAAVEPTPGHYDDAYLASVAATVNNLAAHGIVSLLDFHQDLYNEEFQGEGAPAWAVHHVAGLPNPALGFPWNYFGNPAEIHAWDSFWENLHAADGIGYQDHYAAAWRHVALAFSANPNVLGYEVMNEPWPGSQYASCLAPVTGCPVFDSIMTNFYKKVVKAIRTVDTHTTVWIEPNVLNAQVDSTAVGPIKDAHIGWSFHDYCGTAAIGVSTVPCPVLDTLTITGNKGYASSHNLPWLLTEFGATSDDAYLKQVVANADQYKLGWLEWAYTGGDITSQNSAGQALVLNPALPPTGANVVLPTLKALAEAYPQAIAGTPSAWSFKNGVFTLKYSTAKLSNAFLRFPAGSETDIATPAVQFPNGYSVSVTGASVISAPNAALLRIVSSPGATTISLTVSPL